MDTTSVPVVPVGRATLRVVVMSPHRLVPMALSAAGRCGRVFDVVGSAAGSEEALEVLADTRPDVFVFDPTALSLGRTSRLLADAGNHLLHTHSMAQLLEPAQAATMVAARFVWDAGIRCAMTSQDAPDFWPVAIASAARGAIYASPLASDLFDLAPPRSSGSAFPPRRWVATRSRHLQRTMRGTSRASY